MEAKTNTAKDESKVTISRKSWDEFKDSGLFWWINMLLHTFGWCIVIEKKDSNVTDVYPARTIFRGFSEKSNTSGYQKVAYYIKNNADEIYKEASDE